MLNIQGGAMHTSWGRDNVQGMVLYGECTGLIDG